MDMPIEILQAIASQIPAKEWAQGPSCTCRTLNQLILPCIMIKVRFSQLSCLAECVLCLTVCQSRYLQCTHSFSTMAERESR